MRICFRIVAIILLETQRTTASQRVPLLRRRYPATDSVSDHPFGLNIDQWPSNRGAWRELCTALTYMVHVAPPFYLSPPVDKFRKFWWLDDRLIWCFALINLRLSKYKYFVTFETTIWRLWFSREFPVLADSPSDASGSLVDWQPR